MATIKIKQIKSKIGAPADQKRTLVALGLRKNQDELLFDLYSKLPLVDENLNVRTLLKKLCEKSKENVGSCKSSATKQFIITGKGNSA